MFHFLRKKEQISPSGEKDLNIPDIAEVPSSAEVASTGGGEKKAGSFDFSDNLRDLREAISIQKEMGNSLSPEAVFRITGMSPENLHEFLSGQEMALTAKGGEIMSQIADALDSLEEDGKFEQSIFHRFANNNSVKAAFVALMLLAKFAPLAQGAEHHDNLKEGVKTSKEIKNDVNHEPNPDKTYHLSAKDFNSVSSENYHPNDAKPLDIKLEESTRLASLELSNYFATDKADIINPQAIIADFEVFLSKITPDNAQEIIASDFKLFGSSDERPTSNWNGSNADLTRARLAALDKLLTETLQNYKFDKLPDSLAEKIRSKAFFHEMPLSPTGPEEGVTYITDLDNPATGQKYTSEEVASIKSHDPEKYKLLLDDCRRISFSVAVPKIDFINRMKTRDNKIKGGHEVSPRLSDLPPELFKINEYDNVYLLFDNSPSVGNSYPYMAQVIEKQNFNDLKVNFATFSNRLDGIKQLDSPEEVAEKIREIKYEGNWEERALDVAYTALGKMKAQEKNALFIMTDEAIQEVSWEKIQKIRSLAAKKNASVYFYYGDDKNKAIRQISLDDLERGYEDQAMAAIAPKINFLYNTASKRISALESQQQRQEDLLSRLAARANTPSSQKSLLTSQEKLEEINEKIKHEKEKLAVLMHAWEDDDITAVFAQQEASDLKVGGGKNVQKFNQSMTLNVVADNLGFQAVDLAALSENSSH
ncbi:MAG: VWA domain-containing protein [Patescibacteria group bacterium]|nr:VWA domain-containing protein [Patescibacteria group bacterium]